MTDQETILNMLELNSKYVFNASKHASTMNNKETTKSNSKVETQPPPPYIDDKKINPIQNKNVPLKDETKIEAKKPPRRNRCIKCCLQTKDTFTNKKNPNCLLAYIIVVLCIVILVALVLTVVLSLKNLQNNLNTSPPQIFSKTSSTTSTTSLITTITSTNINPITTTNTTSAITSPFTNITT